MVRATWCFRNEKRKRGRPWSSSPRVHVYRPNDIFHVDDGPLLLHRPSRDSSRLWVWTVSRNRDRRLACAQIDHVTCHVRSDEGTSAAAAKDDGRGTRPSLSLRGRAFRGVGRGQHDYRYRDDPIHIVALRRGPVAVNVERLGFFPDGQCSSREKTSSLKFKFNRFLKF